MVNFLLAIIGGINLGVAWLLPGTLAGVGLTCVAILSLASLYRIQSPKRFHFLFGCLAIGIAFYWLVNTIKDFAGYNILLAFLIYLLFVFVSSLQFLISAWLYKKIRLPTVISSIGLPTCWLLIAIFIPRIFPWYFSHSLTGFLPLAQVADIAGAEFVSFILLWTAYCLVDLVANKKISGAFVFSILVILACGFYGFERIKYYTALTTPTVKTAIVQANISIDEKHNIKLFEKNTGEYIRLTENTLADQSDFLVIWPESVFLDWFAIGVQHTRQDSRLPFFGPKANLLMGTLSFLTQEKIYNSVIGIKKDGSISKPYHKQILMPFGEYMPLSNYFPWIKDLNPTAGDFTAGEAIHLIEFENQSQNYKLAPLICYEDVVPNMARIATERGAQILVNQTNDAWFGKTLAPFQHHQIASFRAIENRRVLLRSTNSGLTAVVDPTGKTTAQLPIFSEGVLDSDIKLLNEKSLYTRGGGQIFQIFLVLIIAVGLIISRKQNSK